jgi:hypothetical protein
MFEIKKV